MMSGAQLEMHIVWSSLCAQSTHQKELVCTALAVLGATARRDALDGKPLTH